MFSLAERRQPANRLAQDAQLQFFHTLLVGRHGLTAAQAGTHAQHVLIDVCFFRTFGGLDEGWVRLTSNVSKESWKSLTENVTAIRAVYDA